ncbi:MAG: PAS domain S-box protein [Ginsengibacter sp.]
MPRAYIKKSPDKRKKNPFTNLFPVVGIGASAGGLEAFKELLKAIPGKSGMAYILVQHLSPDHESSLPEILQRETKIPVHEIRNNVEIKPDHIYIIPSNKILKDINGILKLSPRVDGPTNMPIDIFFTSLGEVHKNEAIGIVLSGNGSDGTKGLKNIKENGGITFAQDPATAGFSDMPQSAIEAEVVDFILAPGKIPAQLIDLDKTLNKVFSSDNSLPAEPKEEDSYRQILALLRLHSGVDFGNYKQTTVRRRILRRMVLGKIENFDLYWQLIKENKEEQDLLFNDLLISVTNFFRDPATFDYLSEKIFPELVKNKLSNTIRVWIAGCATGEEAYSMGICLYEYLNHKNTATRVQIFATDVSEKAIAIARKGIYDKRQLEGVSETRLHHFFTRIDGHYQVKKNIRDMCVFATHNFVKDPPFAKIDLISCRNVLIYMDPILQKKAFNTFHYSLNGESQPAGRQGFLLLGKSETTGNSELFQAIEKKQKIFTRNELPGRMLNLNSVRREEDMKDHDYSIRSSEQKKDDFQKKADDILLSKYTPPGVIVNEQFDIVQFRGSTRDFLEPPTGKASLNVLKMAREGLSFEIRNALHEAKTTNQTYTKKGISFNEKKFVTIEAVPLKGEVELHFLILFKEEASTGDGQLVIGNKQAKTARKNSDEGARITQLENELLLSRENMRGITEDQETINEELQSANEELLSSSEEMQTMNEELETSKEELQSINEELVTLNQELNERNEMYNQARLYSEAIVDTIHEPLLILHKDFIIKSANSSFYKTFQIEEGETLGKVLFELQNNGWDIPELRSQLLKIQEQKEKSVQWELSHSFPVIGNRIICFDARPFQIENEKRQLLLAMEDITERKLLEKRTLLSTIVDNSNDAIISKKLDGTIMSWNKSAETIFGYTREEIIGKNILLMIPPELYHEEEMIISKIKKGEAIPHFNTTRLTKAGKRINVSVTISPIKDEEGKVIGASKISRDITEQINARKKIQISEARNRELLTRFQKLMEKAPVSIAVLKGKDYNVELANEFYLRLVGKENVFIGRPLFDSMPELETQVIKELLDGVMKTGKPCYGNEVELHITWKNQKKRGFYNFVYQPIVEDDETITGIMVVAAEVTDQVMARKRIEESESRLNTLIHSSPFGIGLLHGKDLIISTANEAIIHIWGKGPDVIGKPYLTLLPELIEQGFSEILNEVYSTGKPFTALEVPVDLIRNGKKDCQYYNYVFFAQRNIDDEIDGVGIIAAQVTELATYHENLRESEGRFRVMADLMPGKVTTATPNGGVTYYNKAWLDYAGMSMEELKDFGYHKIMHPDELEEFQKRLQHAGETGKVLEMEMRFMDKDGKYRWHLNRAFPLMDNNGHLKMWIGATTDIQEQKRREEEKSEFISIASHELKTPVTTLKLYIELLQEDLLANDSDKIKKEEQTLILVQKASKSVGKLELLIKELLDVQNINHGKLNLNVTTFDFNELLKETIEEVQLSSPHFTIEKVGIIDSPFKGDRDRLHQVITNLLSNAVKYSPGNSHILVNAKDGNEGIMISVLDHGIGIKKESLNMIFNMYYREEGTRSFKGFGLGLFISSEIVKRHHGKIWAESEPGKGTVVYFTLPK